VEAIAFAVTLVLGVVAIAFSGWAYVMTSKQAEKVLKSADDIQASVRQLEKLFDKMYDGVFGMVSETFADMRSHIPWRDSERPAEADEEIEARADKKVEQLVRKFEGEFARIVGELGATNERFAELQAEFRPQLDHLVAESREAEPEAKREALRRLLRDELRRGEAEGVSLDAVQLVESARERGFTPPDVLATLRRMRGTGEIEMSTSDVASNTRIRLRRPGRDRLRSSRRPSERAEAAKKSLGRPPGE